MGYKASWTRAGIVFENIIRFLIYWIHKRYLDGYDSCSSSKLFKKKIYCGLSKIVPEFKPDLLSRTCQTNTVVQNTWKQTHELLCDTQLNEAKTYSLENSFSTTCFIASLGWPSTGKKRSTPLSFFKRRIIFKWSESVYAVWESGANNFRNHSASFSMFVYQCTLLLTCNVLPKARTDNKLCQIAWANNHLGVAKSVISKRYLIWSTRFQIIISMKESRKQESPLFCNIYHLVFLCVLQKMLLIHFPV